MSIRFEKVNHIYSANTPFAFQALKDIDLELLEGKITAIIGETGSGKSTLVQHLNGLLLPTDGIVNVSSYQLTNKNKPKDIKGLRKEVGLVFQFAEYQLFEETVLKDVAFGPLNFNVDADTANTLAVSALTVCGIEKADFEKSPLEISGGQKRRVALAGILAMQPKVLVLDEPTAGLDPKGASDMMKLFRKLNQENHITIIIVTHNMEHVLDYCDDVVVLSKGEVLMHMDTKTFFENDEYILQADIQAPAIIRFKKMCKDNGLDLPKHILSIEQLVKEIKK